MAEDNGEKKVDWERGPKINVDLTSIPVSKIQEAALTRGVRVGPNKSEDPGRYIADVSKVVVEGMPGPKKK